MPILEEFFKKSLPGWMTRERGRKYVEICLLAGDVLVEGLFQGRLAFFGADPPPDAIPHTSRDRGIVAGLTELPRSIAFRFRRWQWSWRASGLAGVANAFVDAGNGWSALSGGIPISIEGDPTEEGCVLRIDLDGFVGTPGVMYSVSTDGGLTFGTSAALGSATEIAVGPVTLGFRVGQSLPAFSLPIWHGGRGLILNDLGAPSRSGAEGSPAGPESLLYEITNVVGDCRIQLISADGTWWTREVGGYVWRLSGGPWAWEAVADADPEQWSRGLIVITNPPNILPWEVLGADAHSLGEPEASYGTTAITEWWNRLGVTISNFKPANMLVLSTIINFDDTKFDPSDATTCPQDNWYHSHEYSGSGIAWTRPVEYAWFSGPM